MILSTINENVKLAIRDFSNYLMCVGFVDMYSMCEIMRTYYYNVKSDICGI